VAFSAVRCPNPQAACCMEKASVASRCGSRVHTGLCIYIDAFWSWVWRLLLDRSVLDPEMISKSTSLSAVIDSSILVA
jgi:hypothetical protein